MEDQGIEIRIALAVWTLGHEIPPELEERLLKKGYDVQVIREHIKYLCDRYKWPATANGSSAVD